MIFIVSTLFYFMGVLFPLNSNGFVAQRFESSSSGRNFPKPHDRANLLCRHVLKNPELNSSTKRDEEEDSEKWWENVTFEHGDVAERCRPDFEILMSTTIGDDSNIEEKNGDDITRKKKQLIYLDSGATSQKPNQVIQDTTNYYEP